MQAGAAIDTELSIVYEPVPPEDLELAVPYRSYVVLEKANDDM
jgi:hypothetical protein